MRVCKETLYRYNVYAIACQLNRLTTFMSFGDIVVIRNTTFFIWILIPTRILCDAIFYLVEKLIDLNRDWAVVESEKVNDIIQCSVASNKHEHEYVIFKSFVDILMRHLS